MAGCLHCGGGASTACGWRAGVCCRQCRLQRVTVACASTVLEPTGVAHLFVPWLNMMTGICYTAGSPVGPRGRFNPDKRAVPQPSHN